jgi:hypothetical protein
MGEAMRNRYGRGRTEDSWRRRVLFSGSRPACELLLEFRLGLLAELRLVLQPKPGATANLVEYDGIPPWERSIAK